jgi:HD-GYP domain-containing protein (c-di-GMP phosphodiesterase class II)
MKSVRSSLNLLLSLSTISFLVVLVSAVAFFYLNFQLRSQTESYRAGLSRINASISQLNDMEKSSVSAEELARLRQRIEEVEEYLAATNFIQGDPLLAELPRRLRSGELPPEEAVPILGKTARRLSSAFYRQRQRISFGTSLAMGVQLLFLLFFMTALFFIRRFVQRFSRSVSTGIERVRSQFHSGEQAPAEGAIDWKEERELRAAIDELTMEIAYNQELADFTSQGTLEDLLPKIFPLVRRHVPCTRIALAFIDGMDNVIAETAYSTQLPIHLEAGFIEPIADTTLGRVRESGEARIIDDLQAHYEDVHSSNSTQLLLREGVRSNITVPLYFGSQCVGFFFISHNTAGSFTDQHLRYARQAANALKQTLYYHYLLQELLSQTSSAFVALTAKRDNETALHILRMSRFSQIIAKHLLDSERVSITPRFVREVQWFAQLHDIGKIGIPDEILLKPGPLDAGQWETMRGHVAIGEEIITNMDEKIHATTGLSLLSTALDIISGHHEKYDGSGYPRGLAGEDIPLAGRIVALADVFDALTTRRPYKQAFSIEKTLEIMRSSVGTHFDPMVFAAFEESLEKILQIYDEYKEV